MYPWYRSTNDRKVHAWDITASLGKPVLTALCDHTARRQEIKQDDSIGDWCRACLDAMRDDVPQKRLLAELDKARTEWRTKHPRPRNHELDELRVLDRQLT